MAPAFIADSDDESESNAYSPPPGAQLEQPASFLSAKSDDRLDTSKSDEPASVATSSTDPAFFQNVYKEQIAAAMEQQQQQLQQQDQVGYPPAGTEQTDPVSLPSQYPEYFGTGTPLGVGDANRGYGTADGNGRCGNGDVNGGYGNGVKSVIMREKMRQDTAETDPWAVPSSAEDDADMRRGNMASWRGQMGSEVMYRETGGDGPAVEDGGDAMGPPFRKRQRLEAQDVDSSLPPTAPPMMSSLAPTMSVGNGHDPSLVIHPVGLTSSQREEYVAVELPRSSIPEQTQEVSPLEDVVEEMPPPASAKAKTAKKKMSPPRKKSQARKRDKAEMEQSVQLGTPEQTQEDKSTVTVLPDSEDEDYGGDAPRQKEVEEDVYEIQPSPPKVTKKRGRPKKQKDEVKVVPKPLPEIKDTGKKGKKRGRPRKSETVVIEDEKMEDEIPVRQPEEMVEEVVPDEATMNDTMAEETPAEQTPAEETQGEETQGEETQGEETPAPGAKAEEEMKTPIPVKETPRKQMGKIGTPQQGSAGKPLYRIGLSKRSRIAPLLKSLPK